MPAALQGRMDAAQYAALSQRVNVALGPASRSRLSALGTFLGMVAVFLIILAGQQLHLTRDHYFGLLALSLLLWCSTFLLVVIYLLYVRPAPIISPFATTRLAGEFTCWVLSA
jgi:Na+-transporting NADH:ubiquinone oxidoreductase subunit NqrE